MADQYWRYFPPASEKANKLKALKNESSLIKNELSLTEAMLNQIITQITERGQYLQNLRQYTDELALPAIQKLKLTYFKSKKQVVDLKKWQKYALETQQEIEKCELQLETLSSQKEQLTSKKQTLEYRLKVVNEAKIRQLPANAPSLGFVR